MKLLMITGDRALAEGKHGAFYNTIEELHKHWDRIDIITPRITNYYSDSRLRAGTFDEKLRITNLFGNVFIHSSPWPLIYQPRFILKRGLEIFKENKFDVMTVHEYPPFYNGIGARLLWNKIRVPYITEIFHVPGYPEPADVKELIYRQLMNIFIRYDSSKAGAVRVMNGEVGIFLKNKGIPAGKIRLIPAVYVDLDVFRPVNIEKEYDLIFIGRLEPNKGVDLFLEAVKKVQGSMPGVKSLIVGEGSMTEYCRLKIEDWKLQNNVVMHGWAKDQQEISELINKSKILVMTSYNEGGPRVVVEAMACGVPVLATPVGIVPDLLKNLPSGGHMAPGGEIVLWDSKDIAAKILGLLNDFERYQEYRKNGLETAKQFDRRTAIKNYAESLKKLVS